MRTQKQINEQIDLAIGPTDDCRCAGSNYSSMTYEEGVRTALEWVIESSDEKPLEE